MFSTVTRHLLLEDRLSLKWKLAILARLAGLTVPISLSLSLLHNAGLTGIHHHGQLRHGC